MNVSSVTLDEVLRASQLRAASLVPETSGYFALAIADACARLPFRLDDSMVHLSTEGTVKVSRGTEVIEPAQSAASLRDMLSRLLARSIGGMPGLSGAARVRAESSEGVDVVIADLEGALVPVNRAAARRALARLARETAKARDAGKLRRRNRRDRSREHDDVRKPAQPPASRAEAVAAPAHGPRPQPEVEARVEAKVEAPAPRRYLPPADDIDVVVDFSESPPEVAAAPTPTSAMPEAIDMISAFLDDGAPSALDMLAIDDPTAIDSVAMVLEQSRIAAATPAALRESSGAEREPKPRRSSRRDAAGEAVFEAADRRSVDDLVANFSVSQYDSDASMRSTRATLKRLAGLDPTPPPPATAARGSLPPMSSEPDLPIASLHSARGRSAFNSAHVAWLVVGLVLAGLLGHYVPTWLDRTGAAEDADPARRLSQSN